MDFRRLSSRAKDLVEKRGGTDSLKQDAAQLKEIAKGPGSLGDKAKAAAAAIKDPGADGKAAPAAEAAAPPERARADEKIAGRGPRQAQACGRAARAQGWWPSRSRAWRRRRRRGQGCRARETLSVHTEMSSSVRSIAPVAQLDRAADF